MEKKGLAILSSTLMLRNGALAPWIHISPSECRIEMKDSEQEYQEALAYLKTKLSRPRPEVEKWLNSIVDAWVARRKATRPVRKHG
jgi:hypothetical protein